MTAWYNENDKYAAAWLRELISRGLIAPGDVDERSIVDVRPDDLKGYTQCHFFAGIAGWSLALRLAGVGDDERVWTGSCPCQPFSAAGKRKGFADDRHLWPVFRGLIEKCRPATVFGEQVASATDWLRLVRGDLEALEYAVGCMPIEAASAGADHLRDRYWFVADADRGEQDSRRRDDGQVRGFSEAQCQPEHGAAVPGRGSSALDLGDSSSTRLALRPLAEDQRGDVRQERPPAATAGDRSDGTVAVTDSQGQQRQPEHGEVAGQRGGFDVADCASGRAERHAGAIRRATEEGLREVARQGHGYATRGPRTVSEHDWVIGADGKARRVKPGVRLLVDGFPGRVGLLRGFGNAIDPRPAAAFITAWRGFRLSAVSDVSSDGGVFD